MSPHALPVASERTQNDAVSFETYAISQNGFLPADAPLKVLPDSYYAPWEKIIQHLPQLIKSGKLRREVDALPVLTTDKLQNEAEWRRAYVILIFLTHAYVWGGEKAEEVLPPAVSVPLLKVSKHLEVPPVATYAGLNLWNFLSTTDDFADLESLESLHTFTGTKDEAWFYLVSVAMEAQGARIMTDMLNALESIKTRDYDTITKALEGLSANIRKIGALLERMYENCDPMVFFYEIRPFLAGSKNMAAAGLPNGVFYDEGNGRGSWQQLRGGSNGQSSLIQFLDIVLGVEHTSEGNSNPHASKSSPKHKATPAFHEEVRSYMPGPHKRFLEHVSRMGSIREFAKLPVSTPEQEKFRDAYQAATRTMTEFRNKHLQIVTRYIVLPSKKAYNGSKVDLASTSAVKDEQLTGTGGTALMPFLKQTRDETLQAGQFNKERRP
ncbi:indoleamine -dioxygenase pyrrole -dioxygenase [Colletotrichum truncatum]|uniref:Indoleamine -dioxygenase pyrrole -dioxygenase n=1 Tax=Colletotrichum truncatum TaxID=5467 RepID=A0ACC3YR15_COLTU|nr:indoleamine -dioxygenase pyrrole -dioxygenase [Colletotrichum truncatum]KAF6781148.1 indoleamine -dioxygenase pyrrole -dioxygenase [Colletotrichum truncatum]